jgi:tRNA(Ile)-lysidine synthase
VGLSGGGDSLAALIHTCAWAARAGRPVTALSVDHGLQAESAAWTAFAGEQASRLGADFKALPWLGEKPRGSIPAAAREARHALLAEAARTIGACVIVTGHTADDQFENAVMRLGVLHPWGPSPAWPEGRGVFLLRPLLDTRRSDIRASLTADGWGWIDDPANDDQSSLRARVRRAGGEADIEPGLERGSLPRPLEAGGGLLRFSRDGLTARALAVAAVCVGGGSRLPRGRALAHVVARLRAGDRFTTTLCGARIDVDQTAMLTREKGRGGLSQLALTPGRPVVWDGRFELSTDREGLVVGPLAGHAAKLSESEKAKLRRIEAWARPALPSVIQADGSVFCPNLAEGNGVRVRPLVQARYLSACDTLGSERQACDVQCMANAVPRSYVGALG